MYDIGILGGMGPKATAMLFQQLIDFTWAHSDQEHLNIAVVNKIQIPDRSAYLLGRSDESPLPKLMEGISELDQLGVKYILIPCNTSHHFYSQLAESSRGHIINMVSSALHYIAESKLPKRVCVLGTLGTVRTAVYDRFNTYGLSVCYPTEEECEELHRIIYDVKENTESVLLWAQKLGSIIDSIRKRETDVTFAVTCTELSCLQPFLTEKDNVMDVMTLSALTAVVLCGKAKPVFEGYDMEVLCTIAREDINGKR